MKKVVVLAILFLIGHTLVAQVKKKFEYLDVFELEYSGDPQISPDGTYVVYRRTGFDIMKDGSMGNLWLLKTNDPSYHRKLTSQEVNERGARWSPDGKKIAFVSSTEEGSEIYVYWMEEGVFARLTQLSNSPSNLSWSPDGSQLAFTMKVNTKPPVLAKMPAKPKGAKWAPAPRITDRLKHEADGAGYIKPGYTHIFTLPVTGGTPRQITSGPFNHGGSLSWSKKGDKIYFSANRNPNWEYDFRNSEVYAVDIYTRIFTSLTSRPGPDASPMISPDGNKIAFIGFEDKVQAYQTRKLQVMDIDGSNQRVVSGKMDRSISSAVWAPDSKGLYIQYNDLGKTKLGYITLNGKLSEIVDNVGGTTLGRPYASGSFSISNNGLLAYTISFSERPADVAVVSKKDKNRKILTNLNSDLIDHRLMGAMDEIWYKSSVDGRDLQGWIVYPPDFDKRKDYPLIVENHGGLSSNALRRFTLSERWRYKVRELSALIVVDDVDRNRVEIRLSPRQQSTRPAKGMYMLFRK